MVITPRGVALTREQELLATATVAAGAGLQIAAEPALLQQMHFRWSAGAVHWQVYDGFDTTGDLGWDMSWTATSVPDNPWLWEIPFEFKRGIYLKNTGSFPFTVWAHGMKLGGKVSAAPDGRERPRSIGAKMRAYLGVAAGSGVVVMDGPGVLSQLNMRTTPGNAASKVHSYDGLDKNGIFVDSNESLSASGNSFDNWVAAGLRLKHGLFLSNEGTSPVDFLLVGTIQ